MQSHSITTEQDFLKAYDEHADSVFRHCYLRTLDREQSKDLMCEAFKELWLFIARGNNVDSVKVFLFREVNAFLERRNLETLPDHALPAEAPAGMWTFSLEERPLFLLHFVEGFTCQEVCEILGGEFDERFETLSQMRDQYSTFSHAR